MTPTPCGPGCGRPAGGDDLLAWQRLLTALDYADPRLSLAAAWTSPRRGAARCSGRVTPRRDAMHCARPVLEPAAGSGWFRGEQSPASPRASRTSAWPVAGPRGVSTARSVLRLLALLAHAEGRDAR